MYLKEISAYGFKSFADKVSIVFDKGINGVVGPNGSGKSNIVDAVRWVLGEQSIKSLRGDSSSDVIFSGSESRKAMGSASVTLIFDNEDKSLPITYNEVSIKRVTYRSGENEYYLNNERVRLKDITELLADSGTAKESFNIISQGKIDDILSNKPEDRRVFFEEAAGVLKYKRRKEEALRKLDRTNMNLNRVSDIIGELTTNIIPLEEASKKAMKYISIKDRLSNIEVALLAKMITDLNFIYQEDKKKIKALEDEIATLSSSTSTYDIDILKYKDKLKSIRDSISEKQNILIELSKEESTITSDIKLYEERSKYKDEKDKIASNIILLKKDILEIEGNLNSLIGEREVLIKKKDLLLEEIDITTSKSSELGIKKNNINNQIIKNNRDIDSYKYREEYLENAINNNSLVPKPIKSILDNPKFSGIHNIISSLLEVEEKYSVAINIALGSSASYLVVDTSSIAKDLIYYLKNNNLGRATFYPIDKITGRYIPSDIISSIESIPGYIGIASGIVKNDDKYNSIISNVLGNIIICDNIDNANIISERISKKYKIVTLDGQVINVGGSLTGGSITKSNSSISFKNELESIVKKKSVLEDKNKGLTLDMNNLDKELKELNNKLFSLQSDRAMLESKISSLDIDISKIKDDKTNKEKELNDLDSISKSSDIEDSSLSKLAKVREEIAGISKEISLLKVEEESTTNTINEIEETSKNSNNYINRKEKELNNLNIKVNRADVSLDNLLNNLTSNYNMTYEFAKENYSLEMDDNSARDEVIRLKNELEIIGNVNLDAPEEYEKAKERFDFLTKQKEDLISAENTLYDIIKEMDDIMKEKLLDTFEKVREEFKKVYRELFKGGKAELILTEPSNILETGIEIKAEPPGKKLQSISLLSGGEKTFTAISLLFAILNIRPVPFCLFDEVEAALDDANVEAFGKYLKKYQDTQFIIITHKKKTMEYADLLYGITMQESGVSKIVSVKLEDTKK